MSKTETFYINLTHTTLKQVEGKGEGLVLTIKTVPSLLIILMGSIDCATTAVGIMYFGAVELNPFLTSVVSTNLAAFIALKLVTTVFVVLIFRQAEKILMQTPNRGCRAFALTRNLLRAAYVGVVMFSLVVVVNNVLVLARAI